MKNEVSVIVPVYGVEKFIERCARSLFEQTFEDIEYVFVNDCTKDASMEILIKVAKDYPSRNIRIINKDKNEGLPQARKTGVLASNGKYILQIDSDDWVEPDIVDRLYRKAISEDADMVYCDWVEEYGDRRVIFNQNPMTRMQYFKSVLSFKSYAYLWNRLVKRELYEGVEFPIGFMLEDFVITSQLVSKASKVCLVQMPLNHYSRVSSSQSMSDEMHKQIMLQKVENIYAVWSRLNLMCEENLKEQSDNMVYYMLSICLWDNITDIVHKKGILAILIKDLKHICLSRCFNNSIMQQIVIKIYYSSSLYKLSLQ